MNNHLMVIQVEVKDCGLSVVLVDDAKQGYSEEEKEDDRQSLQKLENMVGLEELQLFLGDFNGHIC